MIKVFIFLILKRISFNIEKSLRTHKNQNSTFSAIPLCLLESNNEIFYFFNIKLKSIYTFW